MSSFKSKELFSKLATQIKTSSVREILKIIQNSEIISLAGGMPDPATFPAEELKEICNQILSLDSAHALQYSNTEGLLRLREFLFQSLDQGDKNYYLDNIIITSGSQQGLDLVSKLLVDPGDIVIVELPSYLAALNAFQSYGAEMIGIPMDEEGMMIDMLERKLKELKKQDRTVKFIYTISNFQNPAGVTMSLERRKRILEIARENNLFILEDNPYDKIRFEGEEIPSIFALDSDGIVISLGTFSKILCPGLRLAWITGNHDIIEKITTLKQATDICTPILNQMIASEYCWHGNLENNIQKNIDIYRKKRDVMLKSLKRYFPKETSWTKPEGGFFIFVTLPEYFNTDEMLQEAIKEKVVYVSGSSFYANNKGKNTMRLSFCYPKEEDIEEGIKRLGKVISNKIKSVNI